MIIRIAYLMLGAVALISTWFSLGQPGVFDQAGLLLFRNDSLNLIGPHWLPVIVRDITALGSNWVLLYIMVSLSAILWFSQQRLEATKILMMTVGGVVLSMGLKYVFERPRPDLVPHLIEVYSPSFPSGHASMSMICFLGMAVVLSHGWAFARARRIFILIAIVSAVLVGVSRIMLGVHWPTDVIAGWAIGALWVLYINQYGSRFESMSQAKTRI
ncbi:phosphatase PAP2 family protein [Marinomonas ostreistagni]|uniref:undecaprenyl-diphosphate phosphatase n=1 Tax=Marinomonas ostreistagni TaxID=359209 RepID=A0ABS0ZE14_9GAMM|nr:phosphatase PAP2 family protein [Marinomonas ostreistagni]MBJ7551393.1 phosphatase PAP2 family protein [Marinomonas ostreistagni]